MSISSNPFVATLGGEANFASAKLSAEGAADTKAHIKVESSFIAIRFDNA